MSFDSLVAEVLEVCGYNPKEVESFVSKLYTDMHDMGIIESEEE